MRRIQTYTDTHRMTSCEEVAALRRHRKRENTDGRLRTDCGYSPSSWRRFFNFSLWLRPKHDAILCLLATLVVCTTQTEREGPGGRPTGGGNAPRHVGIIWMSVFRKTCITPSAHGRVQNIERIETNLSQGQCTSLGMSLGFDAFQTLIRSWHVAMHHN